MHLNLGYVTVSLSTLTAPCEVGPTEPNYPALKRLKVLRAARAAQAPSSPSYGEYASTELSQHMYNAAQQAGTHPAQRRLLTCCTPARQPKRPAAHMPLRLTTWPQRVIQEQSVVMNCKRASKQAPTRPQSGS